MIDSITKHLKERENNSWIGIANNLILKALVAELRKHSRMTLIEKVKEHVGIEENKEADRLANKGAKKERPDIIDLSIPHEYDILGAKRATVSSY